MQKPQYLQNCACIALSWCYTAISTGENPTMSKRMKNLNLTERLAQMLEKYAKEQQLSESDIVRRALEDYFKSKQTQE